MSRLVHLSDLHFGALADDTVPALREAIADAGVDLVVVSGDLTQRARPRQFIAARRFLESLPVPWLAVAGNHDVPLLAPVERLARPLRRWHDGIAADRVPLLVAPGLTVCGLTSAHGWTTSGGRLRAEDLQVARRRLRRAPRDDWRALALHHPLLAGATTGRPSPRGWRHALVELIHDCDVHLLLTGHLHCTRSLPLRLRSREIDTGVIAVSAGTATSRRTRGEPNAFNLVETAGGFVTVERRLLRDGAFRATDTRRFPRPPRTPDPTAGPLRSS